MITLEIVRDESTSVPKPTWQSKAASHYTNAHVLLCAGNSCQRHSQPPFLRFQENQLTKKPAYHAAAAAAHAVAATVGHADRSTPPIRQAVPYSNSEYRRQCQLLDQDRTAD
jgi:hypothetical protein